MLSERRDSGTERFRGDRLAVYTPDETRYMLADAHKADLVIEQPEELACLLKKK